MIGVQQNALGGKSPDRWVFRWTKRGRGEMTKAPISLQDLRRRIYRKAKSEKTHRFWGLFVHIAKTETLLAAYRQAKSNGGAPGIDGQSFTDIEAEGLALFLEGLRDDLQTGRYQPQPNRRVDIQRTTARFVRFRFPVSAIVWCRGH